MEQDELAAADNAGHHGAAGLERDENTEVTFDSSGGASGSEVRHAPFTIPFLCSSSEQEALTEKSSEEGIAPVSNAGQRDAFGSSSKNEDHKMPKRNHPATTHYELRGFRPSRRLIAHAMPPSSYRRLPLRSRKRSSPTRFFVVGDAASGVTNAYDPGMSQEASSPPTSAIASLGSVLSPTSQSACASVMVNASHGDNDEAIDSTAIRSETTDAAVSSRSRKQRRPDHFISDSEEAMPINRAKAHRSNTALDRFVTSSSVGASPPEQRPGWVRRNMTEDGVRHKGQPGNEASSREASGGGGTEEKPDGSGRILATVAILGAALTLSVVCFVLIFIAGQQTASGACDTHQKK